MHQDGWYEQEADAMGEAFLAELHDVLSQTHFEEYCECLAVCFDEEG